MAADASTLSVPAQQQGERAAGLQRHRIAGLVVLGSFFTLFLLIGAVIGIAVVQGNTAAATVAEKTFNSILPVLAGWVGTVLAFYFSAQSLERTSTSLDQVLRQAGGPKGANTRVTEKMRPVGAILNLIDLDKTPAATIKLEDLQKQFVVAGEGGPIVTRLVVLEKGVFRHLLHQATLNAFLVKTGNVTASMTFEDLLQDRESADQISKLVAFVSAGSTLAEARAALSAVSGAQDIIVTSNGKAAEPVLGWLTNVALIKALDGG